MGLNFRIGSDSEAEKAQWSYSGFHRFRERLAQEVGLNLNEMQGFGGKKPWEGLEDDIKILLSHSDCDGRMTPEECGKVATRLRALVADWEDCFDKMRAEQLSDSMIVAHARGEHLEFC